MKYLFIGGPADGRRIELKERLSQVLIADPGLLGRQFCYRPMPWTSGEGSIHYIYVCEDMPPESVLVALLAGYQMPLENADSDYIEWVVSSAREICHHVDTKESQFTAFRIQEMGAILKDLQTKLHDKEGELESVKHANHVYHKDLQDAAGELEVPCHGPGTDMAKVLNANILLRRKLEELRQQEEPIPTREQIIEKANGLARLYYKMNGYEVEPGYRFDEAHHPQERNMWYMACLAFDFIEGTEVDSSYMSDDEEDEGDED